MSNNNIEGQMSLDDLNLAEGQPVAEHKEGDNNPGNAFGAGDDADEIVAGLNEAEDVRNGVFMFVVRIDGEDVNATPVLFTMGESGAEPLEDAPSDPNEFYEMVASDMGDLLVQLVGRTEESGMSKSDSMLQLLTDMQNQPQELIHNILATIIVEAAFDKG